MNGGRSILLQELCLLIDALLCFGIPLLGLLILSKRFGRVRKPFILGMIAFTISQLVLRIPLINLVLPNFDWYLRLQATPYFYGIFLGLTAGIFEEVARLIFMILFLKDRKRLADGLAFGLGHGGIEAMLLVGINSIATMVMNPMGLINLSDTSYKLILLGGIERIFAIAFHVGTSLVVLYGIREHKAGRYTTLAVLLHGLLDSMVVILPLALGLSIVQLEVYIMVISFLVLAFGIRLFTHTARKIQIESIVKD